jgi:hypothetical protein
MRRKKIHKNSVFFFIELCNEVGAAFPSRYAQIDIRGREGGRRQKVYKGGLDGPIFSTSTSREASGKRPGEDGRKRRLQ